MCHADQRKQGALPEQIEITAERMILRRKIFTTIGQKRKIMFGSSDILTVDVKEDSKSILLRPKCSMADNKEDKNNKCGTRTDQEPPIPVIHKIENEE